jgi:ABC-type sugar transport system ATPase subunit
VTILSVDSVAKRFGRTTVLSAASLSVEAGRITILFGRNGSGKTTLIRIVTGYVSADAGHVAFLGRRRPKPRLHDMAAEGLFFMPDCYLLTRGRAVADHFICSLADSAATACAKRSTGWASATCSNERVNGCPAGRFAGPSLRSRWPANRSA